MERFVISFSYQGQTFEAEVTMLKGRDHLQYTVWPTDPQLQDEFGAEVFHKFESQPLQTAFPLGDERARAYIDALKQSLNRVNE